MGCVPFVSIWVSVRRLASSVGELACPTRTVVYCFIYIFFFFVISRYRVGGVEMLVSTFDIRRILNKYIEEGSNKKVF